MPQIDYRKPMKARSEEVTFMGGPDENEKSEHRLRIRWHLDQESYDRIFSMNACWNCITAFPARPMELTLGIWRRSGFVHVRPKVVAERLIREGKCPVCASEISPEMLAIHDEGQNPLNDRKD